MSLFFRLIYAYLLTPALLTMLAAFACDRALAYNSEHCEFSEDSWSTLAEITPYLGDLSAQRNFERTILQSRQTIESDGEWQTSLGVTHRDRDKNRETNKLELKSSVMPSLREAGESLSAGSASAENCSKESSIQSIELCSDVVETPISTAPALFTAYQAKRAANSLFETVNAFYHRVDQKLRAEGRLHSSQPDQLLDKENNYPMDMRARAPLVDAVAIKALLSPRLAISKFFSSLPYPPVRRVPLETSCRRVAVNGATCERIPFDSPHGFKLTSYAYVSLLPSTTHHTSLPPKYLGVTQRLPFPPILSLANQRFLEVALPPPQAEKTFFLLSLAPFTLTS